MKTNQNILTLSASDLTTFLGCAHCTNLNMAVAAGDLEKPNWHDPNLDALIERGKEHEDRYIAHLEKQGLKGVRIDHGNIDDTLKYMQQGMDFIAQARLELGNWEGYADVLKKTSKPSKLGNWSYEVLDAKLARETRGATILQICLYSEMLHNLQEIEPEFAYVLTPASSFIPERYRLAEYLAYYRLMKKQFDQYLAKPEKQRPTYPESVEKCEFCEWWGACNQQRRKDDHLSFVAGVSRLQRNELATQGITTLAQLAKMKLPIPFNPTRGSVEGFECAREQARLQLEARTTKKPVYELLPLVPDQGLCILPEPSAGDIYFDIEGDAFVGLFGFEYLLGYAVQKEKSQLEYQKLLADSPNQEKKTFQSFMQMVAAQKKKYPDMHIYHFHSYEPGALKRLMGRYAIEEQAVDELLRAGRFVDLHRVVKHTLRAGVEKYSIKDLEIFFEYKRIVALEEASQARHKLELAIETGAKLSALPAQMLETVVRYNEDDCRATHGLHQWLERIRSEQIVKGHKISRPVLEEGKPSEPLNEKLQVFENLGKTLRQGLPDDLTMYTNEHHAQHVLSYLPGFYHREDKALWWEYFRHRELDDQELLDEKAALSGLLFQKRIEQRKGPVVDRYIFPVQDTTIKPGDELHTKECKFGDVQDIDYANCLVDIEKPGKQADYHPVGVFAHRYIRKDVLEKAVVLVATSIAENGFKTSSEYPAALALLKRDPPKFKKDANLLSYRKRINDPINLAQALALDLDKSVLGIQGPPGTGKTYIGASMILALVKAGKKVGITGPSHKAIRNLLDKTEELAGLAGQEIRCIQKGKDDENATACIKLAKKNQDVPEALQAGTAQIAAGTAWLWAAPIMRNTVDVLFIDEAGQFSLVHSLAVSHATGSLVLLGDPQQLDQPLQGSHPDGVDVSGLSHLLGNYPTMPEDKGLFLSETWRMHPNVCDYISEVFYESKLHARPELVKQGLVHIDYPQGAGLWNVPVQHIGNTNSSPEEAKAVAKLAKKLMKDWQWKDAQGKTHKMGKDDILVVTPYNAQVTEISKQLPGVRVSTVDKFQGQEAPVVIVSYATSTPEDAPRGMDFLYSLNRLNVAVSRARCACFFVASDKLFRPQCRTPWHMKLANGLCRFAEMCNINQTSKFQNLTF